jgi:hypothetical protein
VSTEKLVIFTNSMPEEKKSQVFTQAFNQKRSIDL